MAKKIGRPRKPKREALGEFIRVRLRPDELVEVDTAIRESKQLRANWLRATLLAAARRK